MNVKSPLPDHPDSTRLFNNGVINGGLNLDAQSENDLWLIYGMLHAFPYRVADAWFPRQPKRRVAARNLCSYAANKATAMGLRKEGSIVRAKVYEDICERIYQQLPEYAQW